MRYSPIAIMLAAALLSSCASIVKGSSQSIAIMTPPTDGALCTLSSGQGNWQLMSPGAVTVEKSKDDMQVRCVKQGWQDGFGNIPSNFAGWTLGNIVLGGIIGFGVDAATGAVNQYPNSFLVPMQPVPASAPMPAPYPPPLPRRPGV